MTLPKSKIPSGLKGSGRIINPSRARPAIPPAGPLKSPSQQPSGQQPVGNDSQVEDNGGIVYQTKPRSQEPSQAGRDERLDFMHSQPVEGTTEPNPLMIRRSTLRTTVPVRVLTNSDILTTSRRMAVQGRTVRVRSKTTTRALTSVLLTISSLNTKPSPSRKRSHRQCCNPRGRPNLPIRTALGM